MLTLRGHHLLCILTFIGKGYTPGFVKNLESVIQAINAGQQVRMVWGPDSICCGWLNHPECHCHQVHRLFWRDIAGFIATSIVLRRPIYPGRILTLKQTDVTRMRNAFQKAHSRQACLGCQWFSLCSSIARDNFTQARFNPKSSLAQIAQSPPKSGQ